MKLKNLSLAIFSALMLSACGGGSSSNSNGGKTGTGKVIPPFLSELMGRKSKALLLFKNRWTTIY